MTETDGDRNRLRKQLEETSTKVKACTYSFMSGPICFVSNGALRPIMHHHGNAALSLGEMAILLVDRDEGGATQLDPSPARNARGA